LQKIGILDLRLIKLLQNEQGCNFFASQCTYKNIHGAIISGIPTAIKAKGSANYGPPCNTEKIKKCKP